MALEINQVLGMVAMLYGVAGALSVLLQAWQMYTRGSSGDVSARFLTTYVGGYAIWLLYGLSIGDLPIILVHAVGLLCGTITLAVALRLRGPLPQMATNRLFPKSGKTQACRRPRQFRLLRAQQSRPSGVPGGKDQRGQPEPVSWARSLSRRIEHFGAPVHLLYTPLKTKLAEVVAMSNEAELVSRNQEDEADRNQRITGIPSRTRRATRKTPSHSPGSRESDRKLFNPEW